MARSAQPIIVLIDDNEDDLFLAKRAIRSAGLPNPVVTFNDPVVARDFFKAHRPKNGEGRIGIVFCDIKMPKMTGFDFVQWFRSQPALSGIAIIVMSGGDVEADKERALRLGARAYVKKFPKPKEFANMIPDCRPR